MCLGVLSACMSMDQGGQRKTSDLLGLESQMVVSTTWVPRIDLGASRRTAPRNAVTFKCSEFLCFIISLSWPVSSCAGGFSSQP